MSRPPLLENATRVLLAFSMGIVLGCSAAKPRPNVLIISVDSLRWDHLGVAGYERPVSPNIDRLASRGVHFTRAYAQGSWTRPSVAATFSSAYQSVHHVGITEARVLSEDFLTVAEILRTAGYRTYGWTTNSQIAAVRGFSQGFDEYTADQFSDAELEANVKAVVRASERPFFIFVHFMRTHYPYGPSERFNRYDHYPDAVTITPDNVREINERRMILTPEDIEHNIARYDGTIAQVDERIGEMLTAIEEGGLTNDTVIVVMADHGEQFYEHGMVTHGNSLYDTLIRVPLIISGPGLRTGATVDVPVQNIDILPTLVEMALGSTAGFSQGRDLADLMQGRQADGARPAYSERGVRQQRAVIDGAWKYIVGCSDPDPGNVECEELYNVLEDPYEQENRIDDQKFQDLRHRLAGLIDQLLVVNEQVSSRFELMELDGPVPTRQRERLRALGYVR